MLVLRDLVVKGSHKAEAVRDPEIEPLDGVADAIVDGAHRVLEGLKRDVRVSVPSFLPVPCGARGVLLGVLETLLEGGVDIAGAVLAEGGRDDLAEPRAQEVAVRRPGEYPEESQGEELLVIRIKSRGQGAPGVVRLRDEIAPVGEGLEEPPYRVPVRVSAHEKMSSSPESADSEASSVIFSRESM